MGQWDNPHQLCTVETLLNEIKDLLPNKAKMHHTTVTLVATENKKVAVSHKIKDVLQKTDEDIGWNFHLPLCEEGSHLFLYDEQVTSIQKVHIPFGCALLTRNDVGISGNAGSFGNIRLHGTFTFGKIDSEDMHNFLVRPEEWMGFVMNHAWMKNGSVDKHPEVSVLKDELLQKEVLQKPVLLKAHYALPDAFNAILKK